MTRKIFATILAGAAMLGSAPAVAQGVGVGVGGRVGTGVGVNIGTPPGKVNVGTGADVRGDVGIGTTIPGVTVRDQARVRSQGSLRASTTGIANANANSVLRGSTVISGPLVGLTVGMEVRGSGGARVGVVERIVPWANGRVRNVLVRTTSGRIVPLSPTSVSLSGGVVTTTRLSGRVRN